MISFIGLVDFGFKYHLQIFMDYLLANKSITRFVLQSPCDYSSNKYLKYLNKYLKAIGKLNAHPYQLFPCILHRNLQCGCWPSGTAGTDSDPPSQGLWRGGSAPVFVQLSGDFGAG